MKFYRARITTRLIAREYHKASLSPHCGYLVKSVENKLRAQNIQSRAACNPKMIHVDRGVKKSQTEGGTETFINSHLANTEYTRIPTFIGTAAA